MTTRDPRSRGHVGTEPTGVGAGAGGVREQTQSLSIDDPFAGPEEPSDQPIHPSLALGTHEAEGSVPPPEDRTKVDSPNARHRTPMPPRPVSSSPKATKPPPVPKADEGDFTGRMFGSYRVLELLGKGGMGYVFRAEHTKLGREVALKLLRADYAKRRDAVLRFFQEAKTVNRVRHRNIVDVTDCVDLPDGTTFIIMELLSGTSLGKWARTGIDLPRALAVLVQICDGLAAAHAVGVVHRDLKPDNIMVVPTQDGAETVKLLDFGVAKLLNRDDEDVGFQTAAGSVIGTPAYMSPEQAGGMQIDARSDIYSLGAIMYELFCGQPMFRGRSFGEYVRKHLTEMPPSPRSTQAGAGLDPRLDALIMRSLAKDPNQRFANVLELRDALLGILATMETHPPIATLTGSAVRALPSSISTVLPLPAPLVSPVPHSFLPPTPYPTSTGILLPEHQMLPVPAPLPFVPSLGSQPSSEVSGAHPSAGYQSQHYSYIIPATGVSPPPTPWWVWFVGGAAAVGIGIAAAVWFAGKTDPGLAPAAKDTVAASPIEPEAVTVPTKPLEIKFDSLPAGGVYAQGKSAELCHTPCAVLIDPADGGSMTTRTYVVRAEGYRDTSVEIDLRSARRDYHVPLVRIEPPRAEPPPTSVATEVPTETETDTPERGPKKKSGKKSDPPVKKPPKSGTELIDPTGKGKKHGPIDKTETIDPFK